MNFTGRVKAAIKNYEFERIDEYSAFVIGFLSSTGYVYKETVRGEFAKKDEFIIIKGEELRMEDFYFHPKMDENLNYIAMDFIGNTDIEQFIENGDMAVKRAFLKGAFLSQGSINDPKDSYHFEIAIGNKTEADRLQRVLSDLGVNAKTVERDRKTVLYVKDGSEISDILTLLGAIPETLYFEEQMVIKSARNDTNRRVNCETANLSKTISAGVKQTHAIEKLKENGRLELLDESLYEVAILRLANPDASLKELAMLYGHGISRSGINHRLQKIIELAEE